MLKKILLFYSATILSYAAGYAQLPRWVIPPVYDSISVKVDNAVIETLGAGQSCLWTMDGALLYGTENKILPFHDGMAAIFDKNRKKIVGAVDTYGRSVSLPELQIAYNYPFFSDGLLICHSDGGYAYFRKDGSKAPFPPAVKAYPFHKGYAPYLTYSNMDKRKDPHYDYYKPDGSTISYRIKSNGESKELETEAIDFLSGIGATGKGIGVIRNKLYWFDPQTSTFEPILGGNDNEPEKKRHLNLAANHEQYFLNLPADKVEIRAKYGKKHTARLYFDRHLVPESIWFDEDQLNFADEAPARPEYFSSLTSFEENERYGLSYGGRKVLPAQFEQVGLRYGNKAFVCKNGKWGIIEILPDRKLDLRLNKNEDIAFRHQKFETQIRLDLPPEISAKEARLDIPWQTGCMIDKTSRETKDTESGNFVTYNCTLNIPPSLPDTITEITYSPLAVTYEGLRLFDVPISVKAWHLKYYNVDPIDSETSITNGVASFTININAQRNAGESDYPFDVRIEADSVVVEYEKISETRYKCYISNLKEGDNLMNIYVTEKGCPPSVFPFEIFYTRPVPKTKKKEGVVIRKKSPVIKKELPRLEI